MRTPGELLATVATTVHLLCNHLADKYSLNPPEIVSTVGK